MRALITGVTGFVGGYLARHLLNMDYEVWGTSRDGSCATNFGSKLKVVSMDFNEVDEVIETLNLIKPDFIYHLAGQSSVKLSWSNVQDTFDANVSKTICLLEAVRKSDIAQSVKILTVGSSEEYGRVEESDMPINESTLLRPISPYGITKATVHMLVQQYVNSYQLQIIHARPFNHIGPGQSLGFVTSDFAYQVAQIEKGVMKPEIHVGNLEAQRDFTDVRDIVVAYEMLMKSGEIGNVYNVCSGKPVVIKDILLKNIEMSLNNNIKVIEDPTKMRPSDIPLYMGDPTKITKSTNWTSSISLEESLIGILNYWRNEN
ncbi:MAG: GDP-mannose 4,6-dehydratase [Candidatus Pristimantibacillus sp.]